MLWGTTGTAATFAPAVSPLAIGAVAMGAGGLFQAVYAARSIGGQWRRLLQQWPLVSLGALAVAVYPLAFYTSMHLAGVAVGTVVSIGSAPVASAVIERFADQKPLTRRWLGGAVLGVGGAVLLSIGGHQADGSGAGSGEGIAAQEPWAVPAGIALGLVAGVTYALYSWAAHRLISGGVSSRATMGTVFGVGGVLLIPVLFLTGRPLVESWTNFAVGAYMALVPMFAGYVLFGWGLARIRASTATGLSLVETVVAAVLAVLVVGERLPAAGWIGAAAVLGGLAFLLPQASGPGEPADGWRPDQPSRLPRPTMPATAAVGAFTLGEDKVCAQGHECESGDSQCGGVAADAGNEEDKAQQARS
ncbi:Permease of the drug/metabolite transporter (DMT) superfamily [Arthrobacter sp. 9AX]|uniref:DMT family transporter n=1 Tax=Arthrobacter sp. 9AX TaxID=2653131 RepID=UPI0012F431A5|nr:DMT family transporter [Arthrobacter sp. 9AX]VXB91927.1 Permease of the drug/metabolite transporter (DMT) superfamily [Arthrobacter sp. 9AX]